MKLRSLSFANIVLVVTTTTTSEHQAWGTDPIKNLSQCSLLFFKCPRKQRSNRREKKGDSFLASDTHSTYVQTHVLHTYILLLYFFFLSLWACTRNIYIYNLGSDFVSLSLLKENTQELECIEVCQSKERKKKRGKRRRKGGAVTKSSLLWDTNQPNVFFFSVCVCSFSHFQTHTSRGREKERRRKNCPPKNKRRGRRRDREV